jgi:hypothetical protein
LSCLALLGAARRQRSTAQRSSWRVALRCLRLHGTAARARALPCCMANSSAPRHPHHFLCFAAAPHVSCRRGARGGPRECRDSDLGRQRQPTMGRWGVSAPWPLAPFCLELQTQCQLTATNSVPACLIGHYYMLTQHPPVPQLPGATTAAGHFCGRRLARRGAHCQRHERGQRSGKLAAAAAGRPAADGQHDVPRCEGARADACLLFSRVCARPLFGPVVRP